jgi:hypothetical protein
MQSEVLGVTEMQSTTKAKVRTGDVSQLNWDVLVTPSIPIATSDLPPGMKQAMFQAIASTLIYGNAGLNTSSQGIALYLFLRSSTKSLVSFFAIYSAVEDISFSGSLFMRLISNPLLTVTNPAFAALECQSICLLMI